MTGPVVQVDGLSKKYGEATAVASVSFEVQAGEIFAIVGPNGAGKTTTVEVLEGVRPPTSGRVSVFGADVNDVKATKKIRARVGVLPQEFNALGRLTVKENLEFFAGMYDNPVSVKDLLDLLDLNSSAGERFDRLSGGLRQRVGVAAALVNDPDLVFLDEPTTGLDPEIRRATWGVIKEMKGKQKTVILTTHYMEEAQQLADRIAVLVKGTIAALDTPEGLLAKFGGGKAMVFRQGGDAVFGTLRRFFDAVAMEGNDVVLPFERLRDLEVALTALIDRGLEVEVSLRTPSIEEVFLKLVDSNSSDLGETN